METKANKERKYDLEERTAKFAEDVVKFARRIPKDSVTVRIIEQFVDAGTSIGANFCEAEDAQSKKDFLHKITICKKESRETKYWLRVIATAVPQLKDEARRLWKEANELNLIFGSITKKNKKF